MIDDFGFLKWPEGGFFLFPSKINNRHSTIVNSSRWSPFQARCKNPPCRPFSENGTRRCAVVPSGVTESCGQSVGKADGEHTRPRVFRAAPSLPCGWR